MTRRSGGPNTAPTSPATVTQPMDEDLREVIESAGDPRLVPAFMEMGFLTIPHLLSAQASFMAGSTIPDEELDTLSEEIQRVRGPSTPPSSLCGGYSAFADDGGAFRRLRLIIYNARMRLQRAASAAATAVVAPAPAPVEDTQKPLPPQEIEDLWQAGKRVTAGYASVLPKYRLSDGVVSRMVRNNKAGQLWLPAIDRSFMYKDASSNLVITTLLKCSGDHSSPQPNTSSDVSIQMVQGGQLAERFDPVRLVADYIALLSHRSAAIIACYCTPKAAAAYQASGPFATMQAHSECAVDGQRLLIAPAFVGTLERKLREATRYGMSTAEVLAMDQRVIAAIHERMNNVAVDGNLAVEYVCDQRESLFRADVATTVPLDQLGSSLPGSSHSGHAQSVAPSDSISCVQQSTRGNPSSEVERLRKVNSKLQSERDLALNDLKRKRSGGGSSNRSDGPRRDAASVRGGTTGRSGGGDDRGLQICRHYNMPNGCYRVNCQHRHVCDKPVGRDRVCGDHRHNACTH